MLQLLSQGELTKFSFDKTGNPQSHNAVIPVVSQTQRVLQQAWINTLQLSDDKFGLEADFLSLAGDSIGAINLVSYLGRKHLKISLRDVLKYPVLGAMTGQLKRESDNTHLQPTEYEYTYPWPPGQADFLT
ncbi:hypothetical protein BDV41DRAFT_573893 [Aspergillus transmontanensis]|uniref:Carrier domain-containing protein n=1 Tax=Aspergillus transmontanensis TaxID=1034304 RepID=A0A5N6W9W8_9EURO|nr:hypothetical protein BDV41DRAFT_573893 [Aspergillus transmontanensis]